jgi:TatA/E family protein of Tat protein translocase
LEYRAKELYSNRIATGATVRGGGFMFGIGFQEMLIILVVVLIFFGPKRLPDLAKSLGKGIAEFKKASEEVRKGIEEAVKEEAAAESPKSPETPPSPADAAPPATSPADTTAPPSPATGTTVAGGAATPEIPRPG